MPAQKSPLGHCNHLLIFCYTPMQAQLWPLPHHHGSLPAFANYLAHYSQFLSSGLGETAPISPNTVPNPHGECGHTGLFGPGRLILGGL